MIVHKATLIEIETFKRAVVLASISNYANRVGCLVVKPNRIVAGTLARLDNDGKNIAMSEAKFHAEMVALTMIEPSDKMVLYIARLNSDYSVIDYRPCIRCMRAIKKTPIQQMVYQDPYGHLVREVI